MQKLIDDKNIAISLTEHELNGPMRFAADNLATQEDCDMLIKLANVSSVLQEKLQGCSSVVRRQGRTAISPAAHATCAICFFEILYILLLAV